MSKFDSLNNPVWNALNTIQRPLALTFGLAARYPHNVSPLAGLQKCTAAAFADLAQLVSWGESIALFTTTPPEVPSGWTVERSRWIEQMVCEKPLATELCDLLELQEEDVPDMLALTAATKPGPFLEATIRMGRYRGIRSHAGTLLAMAGERVRLGNFTEISAVCTTPEARGRGYGSALVTAVASRSFADGMTPFLHVKTENGAKQLYEKLGFRVRCSIRLTVLTRAN
ncbi:GNAT family N-acetyltransferase [Komagataeibacter xylinus]|uniref:GNAT family N-acetyltransferase n=1 Tax=Komagataeibacter xylinus TaxID=28448 RepID=UPI00280BA300|nr:GNAT family N-acetyltransferase [Komagataeibacter xylinus]